MGARTQGAVGEFFAVVDPCDLSFKRKSDGPAGPGPFANPGVGPNWQLERPPCGVDDIGSSQIPLGRTRKGLGVYQKEMPPRLSLTSRTAEAGIQQQQAAMSRRGRFLLRKGRPYTSLFSGLVLLFFSGACKAVPNWVQLDEHGR